MDGNLLLFSDQPPSRYHIVPGTKSRLHGATLRELADRGVVLLHACADVSSHAQDHRNGNAGFGHARDGRVAKVVDAQPGHVGRRAHRFPRFADATV